MGKLPANAGSERTAVSGLDNAVAQQPGAHLSQDDLVRTIYPGEMSRRQRRLFEAKIDRPKAKKGRTKPW